MPKLRHRIKEYQHPTPCAGCGRGGRLEIDGKRFCHICGSKVLKEKVR